MSRSSAKQKQAIFLPDNPLVAAWAIWLEQFLADSRPSLYWAKDTELALIRKMREKSLESLTTRPTYKWMQDSELHDVRSQDWIWADVFLRLLEDPNEVNGLGQVSNWMGRESQLAVLIVPLELYRDFLPTRLNSIAQIRPGIVPFSTCLHKVSVITKAAHRTRRMGASA